MRLSISNIAWEPAQDNDIANILRDYDMDAIDVAPTKYFPIVADATKEAIDAVRTWWKDQGIDIVGMQSLLYGTQGLNVFGDVSCQHALLEHLHHVCRIGAGLGARWMVFGSPKSRDRTGLSDTQALDQAVSFFRQAGDVAARHGVTLCLEAVAPMYGANFMTSTMACAAVVRATDHPGVRMLLDTGAMQINGEDPALMADATADLVEHIHLAEPELAPYGDGPADHAAVRDEITRALPDRVAAIEMLTHNTGSPTETIARTLARVSALYRTTSPE